VVAVAMAAVAGGATATDPLADSVSQRNQAR